MEFKLEDWLPMMPMDGPPLPRFLGIYWPWVSKEVELKAGWNTVTYTGGEQTAEEAFASIMDYLIISYHWDADAQVWEQVTADTIMIPGDVYNVKVSQDCVWTF